MAQTLIDKLVEQARVEFWKLARLDADAPEVTYLDDALASTLHGAAGTVLAGDDKKFLGQVLRAIMSSDFGSLRYEVSFDIFAMEAYGNGHELLLSLAQNLIEQLVWQSDRLIAMLLPNYFGSDYTPELTEPSAP